MILQRLVQVSPAVSLCFILTNNLNLEYINSANGVNGEEFQGKIYMRKEQSDFGWDWGPSMAPSGPWRPAYFVQRILGDPVYIHNTLIDIYRDGQMNNMAPDQSQPWVFNASIDFLGALPKDTRLHLSLIDSEGETVENVPLGHVTRSNNTITGSTVIDKPVELWWPNGLGTQSLYNATVSIESPCWKAPATVTKRLGFRTIVLNLGPITEEQSAAGIAPGANWHFEINGHELYAKGSNLVPPDVFWPRVNETKMRELFELVIQGNQNMLRVWSSGAYLSDEIYDLADEMGILLWSEFEFSDAEYPVLTDFLENYEAEAYYNVRRVNHHPSLALWAGGNELEAIILAYFYYPGPVLEGYERVFAELLIKCVYANSRSISYIPSSTYHGYLDLDFDSVRPQTPRYNNKSGDDALYSDTDSYNYDGSQAFNLSSYSVGRFANEFGLISMPSIQSWREAIPEDEFSLDSPGVLHHNRHIPFGGGGDPDELSAAGIAEMTNAVKLWYPEPAAQDPIANFSSWAWSTQVFQADKYASEIAFYRRGSGKRERQLGALFWQLNDLWVAPTWASIEANGRPKVTYYATKDIFKPVIVRPFFDQDADVLEVWVISDAWESVSGEVTLSWIDWKGDDLTYHSLLNSKISAPGQFTIPFQVGPINATRVITYSDVSKLFPNDDAAADALLSLSVSAKERVHSSYFHVAPLKEAALRDPVLKLEVGDEVDSSNGVSFTVSATEAVAAWVWLDWPSTVKGYFDDDAFWLGKGESKTVYFKVWNDWTGDGSWVHEVTVRSMWNNTLEN